MTADPTPAPGDAREARETALNRYFARRDMSAHLDDTFRAGWDTANEAPPLPYVYRAVMPKFAEAHRAGRAARHDHERRIADAARLLRAAQDADAQAHAGEVAG